MNMNRGGSGVGDCSLCGIRFNMTAVDTMQGGGGSWRRLSLHGEEPVQKNEAHLH